MKVTFIASGFNDKDLYDSETVNKKEFIITEKGVDLKKEMVDSPTFFKPQ